jgi:hypothetical protein
LGKYSGTVNRCGSKSHEYARTMASGGREESLSMRSFTVIGAFIVWSLSYWFFFFNKERIYLSNHPNINLDGWEIYYSTMMVDKSDGD